MSEFEQFVKNSWPNRTDDQLRELFIISVGLGGETGEVLELLKRDVRNGLDVKADLLLELGDVLHYLVRIGQRYEITLDDMMKANQKKIEERIASKSGWRTA